MTDTLHRPEPGAGNRSVTRALEILELLATGDQAVRLAEIAKQLELPKSSALSILRALVSREFATVDDNGRYRLGVHCFEVGAAYLRGMSPVQAVEPELRSITKMLGVTSHFAVLDGDEVVYLAKHDPPGTGLRLASSLGARLPAASTAVGKAQLAFKSSLGAGRPAGANGSLAASVAADLADVAAKGYAVDEGATASGIRCVAAPVFNASGCCGAIGISYLQHPSPPIEDTAAAVLEVARRASARLGGHA